MPTRVLADQNLKLTYIPAMVLNTDYKIISPGVAEVKVSVANAGTSIDLQDLVAVEGYQLGATGEGVINDPSLGNIGVGESVPGAVTYNGMLNWFLDPALSSNPEDTYKRGVTGFFLERRGLAATGIWVDTNRAKLYAITFGAQMPITPGDGGFYKYGQAIGISKAFPHTTVKTALS